MLNFRDKVAAITGAGSGIGRALAIELAARDCHLALSDLDHHGLEETARLAREAGAVRITTEILDVADRDALHAWADAAAEAHGAVHLVFNNAGVALVATIEGADDSDLEWVMNVNFWGVVHGTRAFLPHLRAAGEGHIVNVASVFGLIGVPGQAGYNASKFAVRGFTEALRQELDGGPVSATCVLPGGIRTNIARAARFADRTAGPAEGEEAARKAAFERLMITKPERAARIILRAVTRDARRVLIGPDARLIDAVVRLLPAGYQHLIASANRRRRRSALRPPST